jgi:hypothetical protein
MEDVGKFMDIWSILQPFVIFYGHLVYFVVSWYIFPVLVCCTKKNLATLQWSQSYDFYIYNYNSVG